jgi:small subunit ribosomal protein S18
MARDRDRDRRKGGAPNDRRRIPKKKTSVLTSERITWVDYKDVNLLRRFMSERAKIRARRVTGNSTQQQRAVAKAIRVAREMALLPYSVRQVTQRKGGRRERGERGEREMPREMPQPDGAPPPPSVAEGVEEGTAEAELAADVAQPADESAPVEEADSSEAPTASPVADEDA